MRQPTLPTRRSKRLRRPCPTAAESAADGWILRRALPLAAGVGILLALSAQAGDILRGGASASASRRNAEARANAGADAAAAAQTRARDRLARTTQAVNDMRSLQAAARAAATDGGVPNGLTPGGLQRFEPGETNFRWDGASAPTQNGNTVTIQQNLQQAVLHWKSFNVGKQTEVYFDQRAGGADAGKWIAFNKVLGTTAPSQIRGQIRADGQVYIINQNGIIFGAGSQVNARTLVASSLPINDNLIQRGLLNNNRNAAEFLFSGTTGGAVVVEQGAILSAPLDAAGSGGRVVLAGPTVVNQGTISTPSGQTILAAGLQIGFDAHSQAYPAVPNRKLPRGTDDDPSLRGIDAYVGDVGPGGGLVVNSGLIEIPTGNLIMVGKTIDQAGIVDSTTTVTLNGRIDLLANYNAVPNPSYDPDIRGQLAFLNLSTGTVRLGERSVTRILPDISSKATTVGSRLPINSQINIQGNLIHLQNSAMVQAPSGDIAIAAGTWRPVAQQTNERFAFTSGQFFMEKGSFIDVAGSMDVFVPLSHRFLSVQLRGSELAPSPLQRLGPIRGEELIIDIRRTGTYRGQYWMGTPLGDATGFADVLDKNVGQLTARGGSLVIQAGSSVVTRRDSVIDVSGGYFRNEGGPVRTSILRQGSRLVNIADALPDQVFDGLFTGQSTRTQAKWGVSKTFSLPLSPTVGFSEAAYIQGADGGDLAISAPAMALDGGLFGSTVAGPNQIRVKTQSGNTIPSSELPKASTLRLAFEGTREVALGVPTFFTTAKTPPAITFGSSGTLSSPSSPSGDSVAALPADRLQEVLLPSDFYTKTGFGSVEIVNSDGSFTLPESVNLELPELSRLKVTGRSIQIVGSIRAPGGSLDFTAYNISPYEGPINLARDPLMAQPIPVAESGTIQLGRNTTLDVAGTITDDRFPTAGEQARPVVTTGGSVRLVGYSVFLPEGSRLNVSGGAAVSTNGRRVSYGGAGSITIGAGQDLTYPSILGGQLQLQAALAGYAGLGAAGGTLAIKAPLVQIGGAAPGGGTLHLPESFFGNGGFQTFRITGIGAPMPHVAGAPADPDQFTAFVPAVRVAAGAQVAPIVQSLVYQPFPKGGSGPTLGIMTRPPGQRRAASITLESSTIRNSFRDPVTTALATERVAVRGDVVVEAGSSIITEPGGSISLTGSTVSVFGALSAPGGTVTIRGATSFPLDRVLADLATFARPTVHLASSAKVLATGTSVVLPDSFGRRTTRFYDGGSISVSGNIVAESGALLDVSGTSAVADFHPSELGLVTSTAVPLNSGLTSKPYSIRTVEQRIDTNGGRIVLAGHEMLLVDAQLLGRAGGPAAVGGTLAVSSGRFYSPGSSQFGSDINLQVTQSTPSLPGNPVTIGRPVRASDGSILPGMGFFAVDRFQDGGFASLDLGFNSVRGSGLARGGNVQFVGPVRINAPGFLRIASGGVIRADSQVALSAAYIAAGQPMLAPLTPSERENYIPFEKDEPGIPGFREFVAPTGGAGNISFQAGLVDVGTLVFRNASNVSFSAPGGDIRGSGILNVQGTLNLSAGQIYPSTLSRFEIFAYDGPGTTGAINISNGGRTAAPLSAGGTLTLYGSQIRQAGTLIAPFGRIVIGWDGQDQDPATAGVNGPSNAVVGAVLQSPAAQSITLSFGSLTSVSGIDPLTGRELLIPFGVSPDGLTLLDPRGIDVTSSGFPEKSVAIAGESVTAESGSLVDIRGGGELYAYRWVSGNGGAIDVLGTASGNWASGTQYRAGDLVTYQNRTYSARVAIDPNNFDGTGPTPGINRYWSEVAESYAIVPGYASTFAPFSPFNAAASALNGDPGYTSASLRIGDRITLDGSDGRPSGTFTLLPRRYALLPGAFLVSPQTSARFRPIERADGSQLATGYVSNALVRPGTQSPVRTVYEVLSPDVLGERAQYEVFEAGRFIRTAAGRNDLSSVQYVPGDAGYLSFHGNTGLRLDGTVLSRPANGNRGARVDVSSFADITIAGTSAGPGIVLNASTLSAFEAESLVIGGLRTFNSNGSTLAVRSNRITVANAGAPLTAPEVTLAALASIDVTGGSQILGRGNKTETGRQIAVTGNGVFVHVSSDASGRMARSGATASTTPLIRIGPGALLDGTTVSLDSSYGFSLDSSARITSSNVTLGAGQISLLLGAPVPLTGQIDLLNPQLVLAGNVLRQLEGSQSLTLITYQSPIDIYGPGLFGSASLSRLSFETGAIRGFNQGPLATQITAGQVMFSNPRTITAPTAAAAAGSLLINAGSILAGSGNVRIDGYSNVVLNAAGGILFSGTGRLTAQENLRASTAVLAVSQGADHSLVAGNGLLRLDRSGSPAMVSGGLGGSLALRGTRIEVFTDIVAASGRIDLEAQDDVVIGGNLLARGTSRRFHDLIRFTDAGEIRLTSLTGDVILQPGSDVSVAADPFGGNAGFVDVKAAAGIFNALGKFEGQASSGFRTGSFSLDAGSLASFEALRNLLSLGGISESFDLRLRNGDITMTGVTRFNDIFISADGGSVRVVGTLDASGPTGGRIALSARNDILLDSGSLLTVAARRFNGAGKGGEIFLGAGASSNGSPNLAGRVSLLANSQIDLSVASFVPGDINTFVTNPDGSRSRSSAFNGQFQGTLHLRAPQIAGNSNVGVGPLAGTISGASAIVVEGFRVYTPTNGVMDTTLRNQINTDAAAFLGAAGVGNANETAIRAALLTGAPSATAIDPVLVIAPGVEIVNANGDLVLGRANPLGSTAAIDQQQAHTAADWDLSTFRYGSKGAPGVLTLRATGDLIFNNTLSDGFTPVTANANNGWSRMWLAPLATINAALPVNTQSWSYQLTAGADLGAAKTSANLPITALSAGKGSVLVGEFYPAVPNPFTTGQAAGVGAVGQTADTIRFVNSANDTVNRGTRFEVIRTGTGSIGVDAARDVQLRNQFASIYTAGVAIPDNARIFAPGDFVSPVINRGSLGLGNPPQDGNLGAVQQAYFVNYAVSGGDLSIRAGRDIGRFTLLNGAIVADVSRQLPTNWLYRRAAIDPATSDAAGNPLFAPGGVTGAVGSVNDASASTTWWIDYSNFFQGFGALGGGDVLVESGNDLVNADAFIPTNARMAGRDPLTGQNIAPSLNNLVEYGGGDLTARAGGNIVGGSYYVERGRGSIFAGRNITTNSTRTLSKGILTDPAAVQDSLTWMPTLFYVGNSRLDIAARGSALVGPMTNPFLLPQGMNNRFWYKTQFNTFSPNSGASISAYGGSITHRLSVTLPGDLDAIPLLYYWTRNQNVRSPSSSANEQPWLRISETSVENYRTILSVGAPNLSSTAFAGDINIVGDLTLFPSPVGSLELAASGAIPGLQPTGPTTTATGRAVNAWASASINLSDADPARLPSLTSPLAFQTIVGARDQSSLLDTFNEVDPFATVRPSFEEAGDIEGARAAVSRLAALHAAGILHRNNPNPTRLYAMGGDISGITLFSAKQAQILASRDIADVAFYLQNPVQTAISIVSAGRDVILYNENTPLRSLASNDTLSNMIVDPEVETSTGSQTRALAGDVQISGRGALEVLAGRNIDLGTGSNFRFGGLGRGITSVGRARNPFLPFEGARLVALSGLEARGGGPALGLAGSSLNTSEFLARYLTASPTTGVDSLAEIRRLLPGASSEMRAIYALDILFSVLRDSGTEAALTGSYDSGYAAVNTLFGSNSVTANTQVNYGWGPWTSQQQAGAAGDILTRVRDIRTTSGGEITLASTRGGITMAPTIFGNPLTPPGIVTEFGGAVSIFMQQSLNIGQARVFTLRGGDVTIWSSFGDIAAGSAPKTVVTAPPTRVTIDRPSAAVATDLGGLATGGGIGVLAAVADVEAGTVSLIAPEGTVDAGDAGIRATGDITIAAAAVVNADNISSGGTSTGVPSAPTVAAPNIGGLTSASSTTGAATAAAENVANQASQQPQEVVETPSVITVEVVGYGGGADEDL